MAKSNARLRILSPRRGGDSHLRKEPYLRLTGGDVGVGSQVGGVFAVNAYDFGEDRCCCRDPYPGHRAQDLGERADMNHQKDLGLAPRSLSIGEFQGSALHLVV